MLKITRRSDEPFSSNRMRGAHEATLWPLFSRPERGQPRRGNHGHRQRCPHCGARPFKHFKNCTRFDAVPSDS